MTYIGRLAPSPTGAQHVGNARTYLITWLAARTRSGSLNLRIEDIDSPRIKPWATQQIYDDFRWLNLDWDGQPLQQTERLPLYQQALTELQGKELVYPCTCSRKDVESAASAPHAENEGLIYPGTCSHRSVRDANGLSSPYCWRFRLGKETYSYEDGFVGTVTRNRQQIGGDFVVWKADDTPSYQLSVVVDDVDGGITEVIRGDDLIPSTPRQLALYQALGWKLPRFVHVPLVIGTDGKRLAKRHGDTRLDSLRTQGVSSERLLGLLAWSCGWLSSIKAITVRELLPMFRWDSIPKEPFVLTTELLKEIGYAL